MSKLTAAAWILAALAVAIALFNPGGLVIGLLLAGLILGVRYGVPFLGDVIRERQKGVSGAKMEQTSRSRLRGRRGDE